MEEMPTQATLVQRPKVGFLPLDLTCSGFVTHSGEIPTTIELHVSGRWLSGYPIIRIGLALPVNLLRILQNYLVLKLPVIGLSTAQCYGF